MIKHVPAMLAAAFLLPPMATAASEPPHSVATSEAPVFDPARDASADIAEAFAAARSNGRAVMLVFGADWCHDSMALVDMFAQDRFAAMLDQRYEIVLIDVGRRDNNIDVARRYGLDGIEGTPTVLVLRADGNPVNLSDAPRWRNAASRKARAVFRHFERLIAGPAG